MPATLAAQTVTYAYRLGSDTIAVEQFTRTGNKLTGEMVQRSGAAVVRMQYDVTLAGDNRSMTGTLKRMQADGSPLPNTPAEVRFRVTKDSVIRDIAFPDSTQHRAIAAPNGGVINFPTFIYGPTEILAAIRKQRGNADSLAALGVAGNGGFAGITPLGGDSVRLRGGAYAMVLRFDANGRLQSVDGNGTTNKVTATRSTNAVDIAAIARAMKPTGVLSARDVVRGAFGQGGIVLVDYGRPHVRERSVWGGTLVPFDSVWRTGANDATHLFTSRVLAFGDVTVPPGAYTLWIQHTRTGTFLIVSKGIGQWGTQYDASKDLGRVAMTLAPTPSHVEEFTIAVKPAGQNRGTLEFAWGDKAASAAFTATPQR